MAMSSMICRLSAGVDCELTSTYPQWAALEFMAGWISLMFEALWCWVHQGGCGCTACR